MELSWQVKATPQCEIESSYLRASSKVIGFYLILRSSVLSIVRQDAFKSLLHSHVRIRIRHINSRTVLLSTCILFQPSL
jgi:hypothetical protein